MTALPELAVSPKHELPRTGSWLAPREFAFDGSPPPATPAAATTAAAAGLASSVSMPALKLPTLSPTSPKLDVPAAPVPAPVDPTRFLDGHVRPRYSSAGVQLVAAMHEKRRQRTLIDRCRPAHPPACVVRGPTHTKGRLSASAIGAGVHLQEDASMHAVAVVPPRALSTSALGTRLSPQRGGGGNRQRQPLETAAAAVLLAAEERLAVAHAKYDERRRRAEEEAAAELAALASAQEHAGNVEAEVVVEEGKIP